ncbi:hypothetical protein ABZ876_08475 [Streptomyces sp. NPDC046931]|uniref:hypothetical protein n=1 Tax=Streptomyces sp. NPDC046931 TaxID=3154806 RepID=UPI0033FE211E
MPDPSTTRLALYKSKSDGSELVNYTQDLGQNWDKVDTAVGFQIVTSSTRPSSPYPGKPIAESDNSYRTYFSNGTAPASASWVEIPNSSATFNNNIKLAGGKQINIGASSSVAAVAVLATATSDDVMSSRVTGDTVSRYLIEADGATFWGPGGSTGADTSLTRSGTSTLTLAGSLTITGNLTVSGTGQTLPKYKAATTSRASTTTITSDPDITFSVVAGATYLVEGLLLFAADPAGDFKMGWTAPASANFQWSCFGQASTASAGSGSVITDGQDLTSNSFGLGGVTDNNKTMTAQVRGYLTTAGTAGTFALQWAQITSSANATKLLAGTHVTLTRVA